MFTILDYSSALEYSTIRRYTNIVYYYYYYQLHKLFTFMNTQNKHGMGLTYMDTLINGTQCNVLSGQGLSPGPFTFKMSTLS